MTKRGTRVTGYLVMPAVIICLSLRASAAGPETGSANVPIEARATVGSSYAVKADPFLELAWNEERKDYEGEYHIGVRGCIAGSQTIHLRPGATFEMTHDDIRRTGTVQQAQTKWAMAPESADVLPLTTKGFVNTHGTARIELPGEGMYRGGIEFTFEIR